ncbi:MAG TPA: four helix bundle protein [Planctomycetota bacterium]|nr:four helix bundle protein [Planctomycetota bacterium]
MKSFDHEKLDVYKRSIELVVLANEVVEQLPRGRGYLADQLQRAATSIALNIAEGAGEFVPKEKARFYRIARRSATESAAVFDVCLANGLVAQDRYDRARSLLLEIVGMLVRMVRNLGDDTGQGQGQGQGQGEEAPA